MEELIYDLETIQLLRKAVFQTYSENKDYNKFIACVDMIDTMEQKIVEDLKEEINI